jgi:hypothetical protein
MSDRISGEKSDRFFVWIYSDSDMEVTAIVQPIQIRQRSNHGILVVNSSSAVSDEPKTPRRRKSSRMKVKTAQKALMR